VALDGVTAWPDPGLELPPSSSERSTRVARYTSCSARAGPPHTVVVQDPTGSGEDVLVAYASEMLTLPAERWPDAVLMLGDQVYADEPFDVAIEVAFGEAPRTSARRRYRQAADFEWTTTLLLKEPRAVGRTETFRWFLSDSGPSLHDLRRTTTSSTTGNTSAAWRREVRRTSWWSERGGGGGGGVDPIAAFLVPTGIYQLPRQPEPRAPLGCGRSVPPGARARTNAEPLLRAFAKRARWRGRWWPAGDVVVPASTSAGSGLLTIDSLRGRPRPSTRAAA
jgi:hypothetical protein